MKQFIVLALCSLFLYTASSAQTFQTGSYAIDKSTEGYALDSGSGDRTVTVEVTFKKPFDQKPEVIVMVNTMDAEKGANTRYSVRTVSVSRDGFSIQVKTWGDSKIYGIGGSWIAYASK